MQESRQVPLTPQYAVCRAAIGIFGRLIFLFQGLGGCVCTSHTYERQIRYDLGIHANDAVAGF